MSEAFVPTSGKREKKRERERVITLEDRLLGRDIGGDTERQCPPPSLKQTNTHTHT